MIQHLKQIRRALSLFIWTLPLLSQLYLSKCSASELQLPPLTSIESPKKEFLVVMLHGIGGDKESISSLMPMLSQAYQTLHPTENITNFTDRLEIYTPEAKNGQWFKIPDPSEYPGLMFAALYMKQSVIDKLQGFRESLTLLNQEIDSRLNSLNLGRDRLILTGLSQGAMTAMTLALESQKPVKAVVSAISMWMPCEIKSSPSHMLITNAGKDELIPRKASSKSEGLLLERLGKMKGLKTNLQIQNFIEDNHAVSSTQSISILKFLDETVFEAKHMPFKSGNNGSISEDSEEDTENSKSSGPNYADLPEDERRLIEKAILNEWAPILKSWTGLKENHEEKRSEKGDKS